MAWCDKNCFNCKFEDCILPDDEISENESELAAKIEEENQRINLSKEQLRHKRYCEANKEKIRAYQAEYNKRYYEANKEKIAAYKKRWYEVNKVKILEKQKQYHKAKKEQNKETGLSSESPSALYESKIGQIE